MLRGSSRLLVVAALVAGGGAVGLGIASPAVAATGPVAINEVQTSGDTPDFIELVNTGATTVDISGYQLLDDNDDHDRLVLPAGTTLAAGAFVAFDTDPPFGLGGGSDSARLFAADGTTLLDSYTWTTEAATSWGRCPDGTGDFVVTAAATRGAANDCAPPPLPPVRAGASAWPGPQTVQVADGADVLGGDQSGLYYDQDPGIAVPVSDASDGASGFSPHAGDVLWSVQNNPGVLWRLVWNGSIWTPDTANGWAAGKQLRYPDGEGEPDSEGVTMVPGDRDTVFVATERDNTDDGVSKPAILRFDVSGAETELVATAEWDMTDDLPTVDPNQGFEALTWFPDSTLVLDGLLADGVPTKAATAYDPAAFGAHYAGLFLAGLEADGNVYGYALAEDGTTFTRVTVFSSGFPTIMELQYDPDEDVLRAVCDNTCEGQQTVLTVKDGGFTVVNTVNRPTGLPDVNNEGFALVPDTYCVGGLKAAIWADDDGTDGHALRQGAIACTSTPPPSSDFPTPGSSGTEPPLAATGADTGVSLSAGFAAVVIGGALVIVGLHRRRGRHAA